MKGVLRIAMAGAAAFGAVAAAAAAAPAAGDLTLRYTQPAPAMAASAR
jgi:hypothetical protein